MPTLLTYAEAAPQFRKTTASFRYWMQTLDCPLKPVRIQSKVFVTQEQIDAFFAEALSEAS